MTKENDKQVQTNEPDITKANVFAHAEIKEIKEDSSSEDDFIIEGYASTEDMDRYRDITHADAFSKTIKDYMGKNPVVLYMHNMTDPIGRVLVATIEKSKGLFVRVAVSKTAEKARTLIREKILKAFSFGFYVVKSESDDSDKTKKPVRHLREVDLLEISIVSIGANQNALFSLAKALEFGSDIFYTDNYVRHIEKCVNELSDKQTDLESKIIDLEFIAGVGSGKGAGEPLGIFNNEIKAGRVLSAKNRSAVQTAVDALQTAGDALLKVLAVDSVKDDSEDDKNKMSEGGDEKIKGGAINIQKVVIEI